MTRRIRSNGQQKEKKPGGKTKRQTMRLHSRQGFGLNEVIGIAAGIIIAVVVVIPGLRSFAEELILNLTSWWNDMASELFTAT